MTGAVQLELKKMASNEYDFLRRRVGDTMCSERDKIRQEHGRWSWSSLDWTHFSVAGFAGLLTGGIAAWAYYGGPFYPLSHKFGLWILTIALLSARHRRPQAIVASSVALLAAVVAFFFRKKVLYGIKYRGMPYSVNVDQLIEWGFLAVIAGAALGAVFAAIGT